MAATVDISTLLGALATRADLSQGLGQKAEKTALEALADTVSGLAPKRDLDAKADKTSLEALNRTVADLAPKAEIAALAQRLDDATRDTAADLSALTQAVGAKAEAVELDAFAARRLEFQGPVDRPGDGAVNFTLVATVAALAGPGALLPDLPTSLLTISDFGGVVRLTGAAIVAMRQACPIDPRRLYRPRYVIQRRANPSDPSNDSVVCAIVWLDRFGQILPVADDFTIVRDFQSLSTGIGRQEIGSVFCQSPSQDALIRAPSRARYARAFVRNFGPDGVTDVEALGISDVTDATVLAPETADTVAKVQALESQNAGQRLDAIESQIGTPSSISFATKADAQSAIIPQTVTTVALRGRVQAGDGFDGLFVRTGGAIPAGADGFTSHGANFVRVQLSAEILGALILSLPTAPPAQRGLAWRNGGALEVSL